MLDDRIERLSMALDRRLERYRTFHAHLGDRLLYLNPEAQIQKYRADLNRLCRDLLLNHHRILDGYRLKFQHSLSRLETLSPLAVLNRGYSITYGMPDRNVIRSFTGSAQRSEGAGAACRRADRVRGRARRRCRIELWSAVSRSMRSVLAMGRVSLAVEERGGIRGEEEKRSV